MGCQQTFVRQREDNPSYNSLDHEETFSTSSSNKQNSKLTNSKRNKISCEDSCSSHPLLESSLEEKEESTVCKFTQSSNVGKHKGTQQAELDNDTDERRKVKTHIVPKLLSVTNSIHIASYSTDENNNNNNKKISKDKNAQVNKADCEKEEEQEQKQKINQSINMQSNAHYHQTIMSKTFSSEAAQEYQARVEAKRAAEEIKRHRIIMEQFDPIRPLDNFNINHRGLLGRCWDRRAAELGPITFVHAMNDYVMNSKLNNNNNHNKTNAEEQVKPKLPIARSSH